MQKYIPRDYQKQITERVINEKNLGLFIDPGGGKTSIILSALEQILFDQWQDPGKMLVVTTLRIAEMVWSDEVSEWEHLRRVKVVPIVHSTPKKRLQILRSNPCGHVYTINVENFAWLVQVFGKEWPFQWVVFDESSLFKNPSASRFKAFRKVQKYIERTNILTGTPSPKSLEDLWSQVFILDKGKRLGRTLGEFRQRWFDPGRRNGYVVYEWIPKAGAEQEIYQAISDICVSIRVDGIVDEPITTLRKIKLPPDVKKLYDKLQQDLVLELSNGQDVLANTAATLSNKLIQMSNGTVYDVTKQPIAVHDEKLKVLGEILDETSSPVMVVYQYRHDLERIQDYLQTKYPKLKVKVFAGEEDKIAWNNKKIDVLLLHPASAGHGLNLQKGGHIQVWYGLTWNLEHYIQTVRRLVRPGQTERVHIIIIVASGTKETNVAQALSKKNAKQNDLMTALLL